MSRIYIKRKEINNLSFFKEKKRVMSTVFPSLKEMDSVVLSF